MAVNRIVPDFTCEDPGSTRAFYEDVFGLKVVMDMGWVVTLAGTGSSTPQLILFSRDETAPVDADVSIEVDDVDAVHETAVRLGHDVVHPLTDEPWGVRRFFVRDPDGKVVNVLSHR